MADIIQEWSTDEARRIVRIAQFMPQAMIADYVARMMVETITEFVENQDS